MGRLGSTTSARARQMRRVLQPSIDARHESESSPVDGLDEARPLHVVGEYRTYLTDRLRQAIVADRGAGPELREQLLLCHQNVWTFSEIAQNCIGLRPNRKRF